MSKIKQYIDFSIEPDYKGLGPRKNQPRFSEKSPVEAYLDAIDIFIDIDDLSDLQEIRKRIDDFKASYLSLYNKFLLQGKVVSEQSSKIDSLLRKRSFEENKYWTGILIIFICLGMFIAPFNILFNLSQIFLNLLYWFKVGFLKRDSNKNSKQFFEWRDISDTACGVFQERFSNIAKQNRLYKFRSKAMKFTIDQIERENKKLSEEVFKNRIENSFRRDKNKFGYEPRNAEGAKHEIYIRNLLKQIDNLKLVIAQQGATKPLEFEKNSIDSPASYETPVKERRGDQELKSTKNNHNSDQGEFWGDKQSTKDYLGVNPAVNPKDHHHPVYQKDKGITPFEISTKEMESRGPEIQLYYVMNGSEEYHLKRCHKPKGKIFPFSLENAVTLGLRPCGVCFPGIGKQERNDLRSNQHLSMDGKGWLPRSASVN
jgi:hypothetical protein